MNLQIHIIQKEKEHGDILAPTPYKIKQEEQKLDPDTKLPLLDENGEPVTEEKEVTITEFMDACIVMFLLLPDRVRKGNHK